MILKIVAQNALDAFSEPETAGEFIELIKQLKPDEVMFPEGYDADRTQEVPGVVERFTTIT